jgi:primary-amine oxidase
VRYPLDPLSADEFTAAAAILSREQRANNATYKGAVSLDGDRIESFDHIPGVQANFTVDEFLECDELVRKDPEFIAALAKRGITDLDLVFVDTWTYGDAVAPPEFRDRRLG